MTDTVKKAPAKATKTVKKAAPAAKASVAGEDTNPVLKAGREQVEQLTKLYEELVAFNKENLEILVSVSNKAAENAQTLANEIGDFLRTRYEDGVAAAKAVQGAGSVKEAVDLNVEFAKTTLDSLVAEGTKLRDMLPELTKDVVEPLQARVNVAVEKFVKREAA